MAHKAIRLRIGDPMCKKGIWILTAICDTIRNLCHVAQHSRGQWILTEYREYDSRIKLCASQCSHKIAHVGCRRIQLHPRRIKYDDIVNTFNKRSYACAHGRG